MYVSLSDLGLNILLVLTLLLKTEFPIPPDPVVVGRAGNPLQP